MVNAVRERWRDGKGVINGWLAIPSGFSAEVMAQAGWDSLTVDIQHGVQDYQSMLACFQGMQPHNVTALVRVPWNEPGIIGKVLDGGAQGVICPMINTKAQAEAFVSACRYPPLGTRSFGPIRAGIYGQAGPGFTERANAEVLVMPMIETREAIDNLEAILDVPGIDAVYVGPNDLAISLGMAPRSDSEDPALFQIYSRIIEATGKRGQQAGIHCGSGAFAARMQQMGFRLTTIMNDSGLMLTSAKAAIAAAREQSAGIAA
jgi:4-hydroxy-2-oxoheptanedioate aldolase